MYKKLVSSYNEQPDLIKKDTKPYHISQLQNIKESLNKTKKLLDAKVSNNTFMKYWKECDIFRNERKIVKKIINTPYDITKAWMKCYEIITELELIDNQLVENEPFLHFDNAAFPGSFILAVEHYIKTKTDIKKHSWYASSLLEDIKESKQTKYTLSSEHALQDTYGLYKNYPERWLMSNEFNGDVLKEKNQLHICHRIGAKIDLYTSDLGFNIGDDYEAQEEKHTIYNAGQILSGLLTLKRGGHLVIKQYTFFETLSINLLYILSTFFEQMYICKPQTSRDINSEIYIVGKSFLGGVYLEHEYIKILFDICRGSYKINQPVLELTKSIKSFYGQLIVAAKGIFETQDTKFNELIRTIERAINNGHTGAFMDNPVIIEYALLHEVEVETWYRNTSLLPEIK
jgi:hypothetical protein